MVSTNKSSNHAHLRLKKSKWERIIHPLTHFMKTKTKRHIRLLCMIVLLHFGTAKTMKFYYEWGGWKMLKEDLASAYVMGWRSTRSGSCRVITASYNLGSPLEICQPFLSSEMRRTNERITSVWKGQRNKSLLFHSHTISLNHIQSCHNDACMLLMFSPALLQPLLTL